MIDIKEKASVIVALVTPLSREDVVNIDTTNRLVEYLLNTGVSGFYVCGSTGEGLLISDEMRKTMLETVVKQVDGRVPVIDHIGTLTTRRSVELATHAKESGADMISALPPLFYKFSFSEIKEHYYNIASAVNLPFIIYNIPGNTGIEINSQNISGFIKVLPTLRGIKYSSNNIYEMQKIKSIYSDKIMVFSGVDELFYHALLMGIDGAIGTFFGLMPELYITIRDLIFKGRLNEARKMYEISNMIIEIFTENGNYYSKVKEALKWIGFDCGICIKPFSNLSNSEISKIKNKLIIIKGKYAETKNIAFLNML